MFNMLIYHHIPLLYLNFKYREFLFRQHHHDTTGGPSLRMPSRVPRVAERRVGAAGDAMLHCEKKGTWWGAWFFFQNMSPEATLNSENGRANFCRGSRRRCETKRCRRARPQCVMRHFMRHMVSYQTCHTKHVIPLVIAINGGFQFL